MSSIIRQLKAWFALPALALALAACGGTPEIAGGPVVTAPPAGVSASAFRAPSLADENYTVRAKDVVSVTVLGEPELGIERVRIGEDGGFMMPIVGRVQASGRTVAEITNDVRSTLASRYIRNPFVTVNVLELGSHFVTVEGAVEQPGVFTFEPGTTLLGAVAMGRGPSDVAKLDQVIVFREIDGQTSAARFDLNAVRTGTMIDPVLQPEDRIMVGTSGSSRAWQNLLRALPAFAIFTQF